MAKEERNRIVRYLRDTQALFAARKDQPIVSCHYAQSCRFVADAIERGEHWQVAP